MTKLTLSRGLNEGLRKALEHDPKVLIMGEDVGKLGGVFRVTDGLQKDFGEARVIDTPLAESGIVGTAIGLALRGYRPVCEIQFDGFVYPAFDQIERRVDEPVELYLTNRRSEEHTSELQSHSDLVCRLLLEKKKKKNRQQKVRRHTNM